MSTDEDYQKTIFCEHIRKKGVFKGDEVSAVLLKIVRRYIADNILDIGAGSGALIRSLASKGYSAKGVDLYSTSNDIQRGSITDLPFEDGSFSTAFCCDVIEHLSNEQLDSGIAETARVLKERGHFIITTPCDEDLKLNSVVCPECGHQFHRYGHLQSFNEERIRTILNKHAFKVTFMNVYALGAMAKVPLGSYIHFLLKRLQFQFIGKTIVVVAKRL